MDMFAKSEIYDGTWVNRDQRSQIGFRGYPRAWTAASAQRDPRAAAAVARKARRSNGRAGIRTHTFQLSVRNGFYVIDGRLAPQKPLSIQRKGVRYEFQFDKKVAAGNHPLYFTTSPIGNQDGQGSILRPRKLEAIRAAVLRAKRAGSGGVFYIDPSRDIDFGAFDTEKPIYYQCAVHPNMGGRLFLV